MRGVLWLLGVLLILLAVMLRPPGSMAWLLVWGTAAVVWCLVGFVLALAGLASAAVGRFGAGLNAALRSPARGAPAPQKEP